MEFPCVGASHALEDIRTSILRSIEICAELAYQIKNSAMVHLHTFQLAQDPCLLLTVEFGKEYPFHVSNRQHFKFR